MTTMATLFPALVLLLSPARADDADRAACEGLVEGDACVRDDGDEGVCKPDDSDAGALECDDDGLGSSSGTSDCSVADASGAGWFGAAAAAGLLIRRRRGANNL